MRVSTLHLVDLAGSERTSKPGCMILLGFSVHQGGAINLGCVIIDWFRYRVIVMLGLRCAITLACVILLGLICAINRESYSYSPGIKVGRFTV